MASKYAKAMEIPAKFPGILRDFTREVLRQQGVIETKEAIYAFGLQYFKDLTVSQSGTSKVAKTVMSASTPAFMQMDDVDTKDFVIAAFNSVSQQFEGLVAYEQFKQVLEQLGEQLQISSAELKALYAEADENEEGIINLADFLPLGIQALLQLRLTHLQRLARITSLKSCKTEDFLHGMMQDEMESILREIFQRADKDEEGVVTRSALMDALRDADLGFTRKEVNILMSEAPVAEEDKSVVVYSTFLPMCFPLLKEMYNYGILEAPKDPTWIAQCLTEVFVSGDSENTGLLTTAEIARLLRAADVGLTRLQISAVMAEAQEDKTGFVYYEALAARISGMVLALTNVNSHASYSAYLQRYRRTSEYYTVLDMNQHTFEQALSRALQAIDEQDRGVLFRDEVVEAIGSAFPEINDRQLRSLLALSESNTMGEINYNFITRSAFQALQKLQEYDMMIAS